jgi:3-phosphoshikimate 1-carboxyvinyltransferase
MVYEITRDNKELVGTLTLPTSKSESNRALIIREFVHEGFRIQNLSDSQDTQTLLRILNEDKSNTDAERIYDVGSAGTTMRFLISLFANRPGVRILKGTERMHQRPVRILVDALREIGAKIDYLGKEGFPPIRITGTTLKGGTLEMDGSVSSQYISSLLMVAPTLPLGLVIKLKGEIASRPYMNMTLKLMEKFGVSGLLQENGISVSPQRYHHSADEMEDGFEIEADWSAASYWYAMAAFSEKVDLTLKGLRKTSLQGDSILPDLFTLYGVSTEILEDGIRLTKSPVLIDRFGYDFIDCPDIVQTMGVVTSALGIPCLYRGLRTLKIKETDRGNALRNELKKFGLDFQVKSDDAAWFMETKGISEPIDMSIATYDDHRMAMAFASLAMKTGRVRIENPQVVSKSYPAFWNDMAAVGFKIREL